MIQFEVQDTGIGIPPDKQALIFTRLTTASRLSRPYAGFGLGLALVKQFITELDGEISVTALKIRVTTFIALIPLRESLASRHSPKVPEFILHHDQRDNTWVVVDPVDHAVTPDSAK